MLNDYTKAYGEATFSAAGTGFTYNRSAAANYALTYTSSYPASTCPADSTIHMDTSKYNQTLIYKNVWKVTTTTCNDCADFISQALRAGGFPVDTGKSPNWTYSVHDGIYYGTYAWRVFDNTSNPMGLRYYLETNLHATSIYSLYTSLLIGDLMYVPVVNHIVMVTRISPFGYSGHTNDRKNQSYDPTLKGFLHVLTNVP